MLEADKHAFVSADAPPQEDRSPAHGDPGAGRERIGDLGRRPRLLAGRGEGVRRSGAGARSWPPWGRSRPARSGAWAMSVGKQRSARTPTSSSTPGRWPATSARWRPPARPSIRCRSTRTPRSAIRSRRGRPSTGRAAVPTDDVLPIWKAAAPALDLLAPDIYMDDYAKVDKVMELYRRPDNPLLIPEISNAAGSTRASSSSRSATGRSASRPSGSTSRATRTFRSARRR